MIANYMSVAETAEQWSLTNRMVQKLCADGKIEGAVKFGRSWAIPKGSKKPADLRVKSGKWTGYRNRMKKTVQESKKEG